MVSDCCQGSVAMFRTLAEPHTGGQIWLETASGCIYTTCTWKMHWWSNLKGCGTMHTRKVVIALDEKLKEYADRFGQNFPVFFFRNKSEAEITALVEGCLKENRPFQVTEGGDVDV